MRIIVVGAGEVGSYVADRLSREDHDVVVIDTNRERLRELNDSHDVLTVLGSGTSPTVLEEARIDRADMLVAVTDKDEVNLLACLQGKQAGVSRTVARLQSSDLRGVAGRKVRDAVGVDLVLDPDEQTAGAIHELLVYQGATDINDMANGEVLLVGARLGEDAPIVGKSLSAIGAEYEPEWDFIFGTLTRDGETRVLRDDPVLESHDLLRVVCRRRGRRELTSIMGLNRTELRRVMLLGGGRTAELLTVRLLGRGVEVVIVEGSYERCVELSEDLPHALVLHGDITDSDLLARENVGSFDAVVASTGEDDANVLACLFAKSEGAPETIAVVHRLSLLSLLDQVGIDAALSPRTASANSVLRYVRGDVTAVATFLEGDVEVLEVEVKPGSDAEDASVGSLGLPRDVLIGAIVRDGNATIARGRSVLRSRDHVIMFSTPQSVGEARQAFG
ncbi:MAG: trk system potassium uptake protein TrkA [Candidatus Poriferisodalaceae bacterium]